MQESSHDVQRLKALMLENDGWSDLQNALRETVKLGFGYPGNKFDQLEHILPVLPMGDVFVDGFGGSASISLNVPEYPLHIFNDKCSGVTAFFRCLGDNELLNQLIEKIDLMIFSYEEFLFTRDSWKALHLNFVERAARWFYTLHCSFNSKGREWARVRKPSGSRVGRFGKLSEHFATLYPKVSQWQIENDDWWQMIKRYDSERTVFYFDPTYYDCTENMYEHEMSKIEHYNLLGAIFDCKGFVAISGYPNKLYDSYSWDDRVEWNHTKTTQAGIACEENNWTGREGKQTQLQTKEVLWIKEAS